MTKEKHQIKADLRTVLGRKVRKLRKEGFIPATVYGHKFDSLSIQFKALELEKFYDEVGESGLVELMIGEDNKLPILFRNPQYSAVEGNLIHIDCYKVNLKEKITASVPIEFIGESMAVKEGNVLVEVTTEVEVEALPTDLPEKFEVDISVLNAVDDMITVADLEVDEKVEMVTDLEQVIVKIEAQRAEEEIIEEPVEGAEPVEVPATEQKGESESDESTSDKEEKTEE